MNIEKVNKKIYVGFPIERALDVLSNKDMINELKKRGLNPQSIIDKWKQDGEAYGWLDEYGEKAAMFSEEDVLDMMKELINQ